MIYLASPYSHPDPDIREQRFDSSCRAAGKLMDDGHLVYSPIAHTHPIAERCDLPLGWDYWERFDRAMIERCDVVVVLTIDGWQDSVGIKAEKAIANRCGLSVYYWDGVGQIPITVRS